MRSKRCSTEYSAVTKRKPILKGRDSDRNAICLGPQSTKILEGRIRDTRKNRNELSGLINPSPNRRSSRQKILILRYLMQYFFVEIIRLILEDMWLSLRDCLHRFRTAVWFALTILGWTTHISFELVVYLLFLVPTTMHFHGRTRPLPNTEPCMMDHSSLSVSRVSYIT